MNFRRARLALIFANKETRAFIVLTTAGATGAVGTRTTVAVSDRTHGGTHTPELPLVTENPEWKLGLIPP